MTGKILQFSFPNTIYFGAGTIEAVADLMVLYKQVV